MKRTVTTALVLVFGISLCSGQNLREAAEQQRRREAQQRIEAKERLELRYQSLMESAKKNFEEQQYAQAKDEYNTALTLKPENAAVINPKIAEIDSLLRVQAQQRAAAERERERQRAEVERERERKRVEVEREQQRQYVESERRLQQQRAEAERKAAEQRAEAERKEKTKKVLTWVAIGIAVIIALAGG